jgi:hypothetical protein
MKEQDGAISRTKSIKFSDNQKVRDELEQSSQPMGLTNFFIRRPCVSILVPYFLLFVIAFITQAAGFINLDFRPDDSQLVNDNQIVIERDMIKFAHEELNREEEGIDDKRDKMLENQIRYQ